MMRHIKNIYHLGVKELITLCTDWMMLSLILFSFTVMIIIASKEADSIHNAPIAIVDEDGSQLSQKIYDAFFPPLFMRPQMISRQEIDEGLDMAHYTFVLVIPYRFEKDVRAHRNPKIQLNVDATQMSQAFVGSGYIQQIVMNELTNFLNDPNANAAVLVKRDRFNPNLIATWFDSISQLINNITILSIILTGAALIRERENGTLEHLLVMPVTASEIMISKIWSMMLVVLIVASGSLYLVIHKFMNVPIEGSIPLFIFGMALHLFATTAMGIFLACVAKSMPQLGMLIILVLMPMQMLSGGSTPQESMPAWVQYMMKFAPTTHFVNFSQAILFRGAGIDVVWKPFLALLGIGVGLFLFSLSRFRKSLQ